MVHELGRILDALPGFAWTTYPDGRVEFRNRRWREYLGLGTEDGADFDARATVHPEDLPRVLEHWKASTETGECRQTEVRLRRHDGVYRWFLVSSSPERDATGSIVRWHSLNTDIEHQKQLEERSRLDPATTKAADGVPADLRSIIDTIPMAAWTTDADGYCDFLNRPWLAYSGLTLEQALGWGWAKAIHPDDLPGLTAHWRACLESGDQTPTEARMRRYDGVYRWFLFVGNAVRDEAGNIRKWFGANIDIEDRKRAEEALRASERNLVQIINTIPTTAWSTLPDGYCDFLSNGWLEYAGFKMGEGLGWDWCKVIHPDDARGLIEYWRAALANGTPVDFEARMRRFDGEYRWFLFRANPLRDDSGRIVKWYGFNVDIEDRKRADEALQASERNLIEIIDTIPTTAWTTRPDGFCDFLNRRWLDYAGMTAEQARGWGWGDVIHPDDREDLVSYWQGCLASGAAVDTEARMRRFDGVYRWFLFRANPLRDASGSIVRWYGTNVDIEDRKRAVEELRRSKVLLAEGQRVSQTGSFYWRAETDELRSSEQLYRILGFEPGSSVTLSRIAERVHAEDLHLLDAQVARARAAETDLDCEVRLRTADGSLKYLRMTAYGTREDDGLEYVGAVQDVTERRLSEAALATVRSELAYMTRVASMGALTASVAHEVNQPLSGIITNATTCLRMLSADPPNVQGALETARRSMRDGKRATDVITRLRALFANRSTTTEPVDLNEATREVLALSVNELQRNRVTVHTEFAPDLPAIRGDRIQLQQVILNLLLNASAAMSAVEGRPRQLVIRTEKYGVDHVSLSVQDVGAGIHADDEEKLFQAFYTTKTGGLGIGLFVSRSIIDHHGGRLWATRNTGPGTTFTFSIPLAPSVGADVETVGS